VRTRGVIIGTVMARTRRMWPPVVNYHRASWRRVLTTARDEPEQLGRTHEQSMQTCNVAIIDCTSTHTVAAARERDATCKMHELMSRPFARRTPSQPPLCAIPLFVCHVRAACVNTPTQRHRFACVK